MTVCEGNTRGGNKQYSWSLGIGEVYAACSASGGKDYVIFRACLWGPGREMLIWLKALGIVVRRLFLHELSISSE